MHIGDINVGDFLTPLDGQPTKHQQGIMFYVWGCDEEERKKPDFRGCIYRVLALDFPFAVMETADQTRELMDLRDHVWKRLSPEFVQIALGAKHNV